MYEALGQHPGTDQESAADQDDAMDGTATDQGHNSSEHDDHREEHRRGGEDSYKGLLHFGTSLLAAIASSGETANG